MDRLRQIEQNVRNGYVHTETNHWDDIAWLIREVKSLRRRSTPPRSRVLDVTSVHSLAGSLARSVGRFDTDYTRLHPCGWDRAHHGKPEGGAGAEPRDTSDLMIGKPAAVRKCLTAASVDLQRAHDALDDGLAQLDGIASILDGAHAGPPAHIAQRAQIVPHPDDVATVSAARAAQVKREMRARDAATPWARDEISG